MPDNLAELVFMYDEKIIHWSLTNKDTDKFDINGKFDYMEVVFISENLNYVVYKITDLALWLKIYLIKDVVDQTIKLNK